MARIYSGKKGKSGSHRPVLKIKPKWVKQTAEEVEKLVVELAKSKYSSSDIGIALRDRYGIPDVKLIANKTIGQIIKENGLQPNYPEDLLNLFKKVVVIKEHLSANKSDKHTKKGLENLESKIRRLIKYYTREEKIPKGFVYDYQKVKLLVQK
ncbi:MAG: 30S ribosomal protein S15 [Candidatus Aenigmarchaeota archaeon]|nr:30S ribosomal protein S15 [Candidatus Aenigmarchaeota archaeon]